jgi:phosphopantetheinyl transferase (holo-ACP synthase)
MIPIGNDVVDFELTKKQTNWRRMGYLSKLFTDSEQSDINNSHNQDLAVWQLWSQKEAVYKIIRQLGASRGFYPKKIIGNLNNSDFQKVSFENQVFYCQTTIFEQHLHTIALVEKAHFSAVQNIVQKDKVFKIGEFPYLQINENQNIPISISHHGKFEYCVGIYDKL